MKALILEDDDLIAELLETVVAGLYSGASVIWVDTLAKAFDEVGGNHFDLYIVDRSLPDGSGLDLVKRIREKDPEVPVVMVSGRSDRESVLQAAHYGIDGYMTKPFDVATLHERLRNLLKIEQSELPEIGTLLKDSLDRVIQLPTDVDPVDVLDLMSRQEELSVAQLAERWREEASLSARLLDVANSSSFRRSGKPVETLRDAISSLGVSLALNQALALSLDVSNKLKHETLKALAKEHHEAALQVAKDAQRLAIRLKKQPVLLQKAGLLSRLGELAVLKVLNQYTAAGGELDASDAEKLMSEWAQSYGNRLKVQWKLPLGVRELIGAVHYLPGDCTREDRVLMRAASMMAAGEQDSEECHKLLRRLGIVIEDTK